MAVNPRVCVCARAQDREWRPGDRDRARTTEREREREREKGESEGMSYMCFVSVASQLILNSLRVHANVCARTRTCHRAPTLLHSHQPTNSPAPHPLTCPTPLPLPFDATRTPPPPYPPPTHPSHSALSAFHGYIPPALLPPPQTPPAPSCLLVAPPLSLPAPSQPLTCLTSPTRIADHSYDHSPPVPPPPAAPHHTFHAVNSRQRLTCNLQSC